VAQMRVYGQMNEQIRNMMNDNINPTYYRKGIEVTDFIMEYELDFCSGNVIKYLVRQGKKNPNGLEDLNKAKWYLNRLIKEMENNNG
jgi:predicted nucleotidyltransferase